MNLLDAFVTHRQGEVYFKYDKWWTPVEYVCWGRPGQGSIMSDTKEEAEAIKIGHKFQV